MYALMSIDHDPGNAVECLEAATGMPHSASAILDSTFPGQIELAAAGNVVYSASTASWVVFSAAALHTQLQLVVSSKHGNVKQACEDIWRAFRSAASNLSPKLARMEIIDPSSTAPIARGEVGLKTLLRRTDFVLALWPGIVTVCLIGVGRLVGLFADGSAADVWLAGSPAMVVSVVAALLLIRETFRGEVTWAG